MARTGSKKRRERRKRRENKKILKHGKEAKRAHTHPGGRTGSIMNKNIAARGVK